MILLNGHENLQDYPFVVAPVDMTLPDSLKGKTVLRADATLKDQLEKQFPPADPPTPTWTLDPQAGTYTIVTPRSETFALPAEVSSAEGSMVGISGNTSVAVCFTGSLDGQPLAQSHRALVLYLTDLKNTGSTIDYEGKQRMVLRNFGTLPLLVRQGKIQMTLKTKGRPLPKVWALKYDGTRSVPITPQATLDGCSFTVQAVTDPETFCAYELEWE